MENTPLTLILTETEKEIIESFLPSGKIAEKQLDGSYKLLLDDDMAEMLAEKVQGIYATQGFNSNYGLTSKGKILEALVDKFSGIGW